MKKNTDGRDSLSGSSNCSYKTQEDFKAGDAVFVFADPQANDNILPSSPCTRFIPRQNNYGSFVDGEVETSIIKKLLTLETNVRRSECCPWMHLGVYQVRLSR